MLKLLLFLIAFTLTVPANAQPGKTKILRCFDVYEYYPDSTIKAAYHVKNGKYNDYAIEYDTTGAPAKIGIYKKGKKSGNWLYSSGAAERYKKGKTDGLITVPGCGTGKAQAKDSFRMLYEKLTGCR